jgi:hypothetical protein
MRHARVVLAPFDQPEEFLLIRSGFVRADGMDARSEC